MGTLAGIESGAQQPSVTVLDRLLAAVALDLVLVRRQPDHESAELERYLRLSLSQRLWCSLGGERDVRWSNEKLPAFAELAGLARSHKVALVGAAAIGIWLPGRKARSRFRC